jgi:predicted ATPase/class 3 adenylate cyclase
VIEVPSGTVTFLFTDIEGSTRLWERNPVAMGNALERHDALLRDAIGQNDGRVFATGGDAFCTAFHTADAALRAALAAQRALAREPWPTATPIRVRMALHTGTAEMRGNDFFGPPLNRVARLLSAGYGGQVLLSQATQELIRDDLPTGATLRDMGERRLKDLIRPERVYQLVASDLADEFPPLKTLDARAHNLPQQLTSFVGREREMGQVKDLVRSTRLVTLTGAGGAGKTRLALQASADLIDDFAHGVWFVDLAALGDERLVPQAVATVLGVRERPGAAIADALVEAMGDRELLLVLDNCEHLIQAAAALSQRMLSAAAGVRILATSREALRIPGEVTYRVPSLAAPGPRTPAHIDALAQYAAVQLFIDRARAVQPSFHVDDANAPAVASICYQLDGIPLAIELAAARVRSLTVTEVNDRLGQRFRLLTSGARTALPRQQTLRALIDWSFDLLNASERALLCRVACFAGGWTADAATAVATDAPMVADEVPDLLSALADKSLVVAEDRGGATRYRLPETVRQYARERLLELGEDARCRRRHFEWFLSLVLEAEPRLTGPEQKGWLDRLEAEHDNLRAALEWAAAADGARANGLRLAGNLFWFWYVRGYLGEGRAWISGFLAAAPDADASVRAKALQNGGSLAWQQGDYTAARALHEEALALWRALGNRMSEAVALNNLGLVARDSGDLRSAESLWEQSVAIHREIGNPKGVADSLSNLGIVAKDRGDYALARDRYRGSLAIRREIGDQRGIAMALNNLGAAAFLEGDYESSRPLFVEGLAIRRELGDRRGIASSLNNLAIAAFRQRDYAAAGPLFEEALTIRTELGDKQGIGICLCDMGLMASQQGNAATAFERLSKSLAIARDIGDRDLIAACLAGLAEVALAMNEPARACRVWGTAERLREEIDTPLPPSDRPEHERQVAAARTALGSDAAFTRAWQEGRDMTQAQAVDYALGE